MVMAEIWAVLEQRAGTLDEQAGELLAEVAEIARRQSTETHVCALVLAAPETALPDTTLLGGLDVQRLYIVEHPLLASYSTEGYVTALAGFMQERKPLLVATSATANGRDWMPRLAARLHLPFASACLGLDLRDDSLFALRTVYEGRAYIQTRTVLHGRSALVTLLPGVRDKPPITSSEQREGQEQREQPVTVQCIIPDIRQSPEEGHIRSLAIEAPSPEAVELEAAERIVAGGRGVGREGFAQIASFARLLGAAVGATRVATDRGWIEHARQIGATGKSVHPRLYIACGISGAAQHTSGMREAQTVVAINPDRSAPIFALADLGLLGDANQILPLAAELIANERGLTE